MRRGTDAGGRATAWWAAGVAAVLLLTAQGRAASISFAGTSAGVFSMPAGDTYSGVGTGSISFGSPPGALSFTGTSFTAAAGQVFQFGSIGYYNAENVNPILGVDLSLTFNMTAGSAKGEPTFTLPLTMTNTATVGTADELGVVADGEIGTLVGTDGTTYSLLIKGFGCGCAGDGSPIINPTLSASEGQIVCAAMYAVLVEKEPPPAGTPPGGGVPSVPEPATLVLSAAGLVTLGVRRFRR